MLCVALSHRDRRSIHAPVNTLGEDRGMSWLLQKPPCKSVSVALSCSVSSEDRRTGSTNSKRGAKPCCAYLAKRANSTTVSTPPGLHSQNRQVLFLVVYFCSFFLTFVVVVAASVEATTHDAPRAVVLLRMSPLLTCYFCWCCCQRPKHRHVTRATTNLSVSTAAC